MWKVPYPITLFPITLFLIGLLASNLAFSKSYDSDRLHDSFDAMLQAYVVDGQVNYPGFQNDERFVEYLDFLATARPQELATEKEQLAFYVNAYNALTIKGILDGKSPGSLIGRYKFFISSKYDLAGKKISLDELEKKIIIPYNDPGIHFAIVCASASCPKLISRAYRAETLDQQFADNARTFLNNTEKNKLDSDKKAIKLSKIFKWFAEDFEKESGSVQKYIAQYVEDPALVEKLKNDAFKVRYLKYDWSLNGTPPSS